MLITWMETQPNENTLCGSPCSGMVERASNVINGCVPGACVCFLKSDVTILAIPKSANLTTKCLVAKKYIIRVWMMSQL